jgi:hypothetical protein
VVAKLAVGVLPAESRANSQASSLESVAIFVLFAVRVEQTVFIFCNSRFFFNTGTIPALMSRGAISE